MIKQKMFFLFLIFFFLSVVSFAQQEDPRQIFIQAGQSAQQGDYDQAVALYEKLIDISPNFAPAYNLLGLVYQSRGLNPEEVAWYFKTAVDIDPTYEDALINLGKSYYGLGHFDLAEKHILKALEVNPASLDAKLSLGWIYLLGKSRPLDSIVFFREVAHHWKHPSAYFGLGMAYFMSGESARVLECITSLREIKEENLAEQLEMIIRSGEYAAKVQKEQSVLPSAPAGSPDPLLRYPSVPPQATMNYFPQGGTQVTVSGSMPVRLTGQFIFDDEESGGTSTIGSPAPPTFNPPAPRVPPKVLKSQ